LLRANLESLGIAVTGPKARSFAGVAEIIAADAMQGLDQLAERAAPVDIIFADPPYADAPAYAALLDWLGDSELLAAGGRLVLEHSRRLTLPVVAGRLERARLAGQGDTVLSFYLPVLAA
jgi:16S rRNA G966 N2-methylase RsmD